MGSCDFKKSFYFGIGIAYLEPIRSYAWSNSHSDPDLGSVGHFQSSKLDSPSLMFWLEENLTPSNVLIRGKSNFDDWKSPTQQSFIPQEITS